MGDGLVEMSAQPVSFEVDGKVYYLHPMTMTDYGKLGRWAEGKFFADMRRRLEALPADAVQAKARLYARIVNISVEGLNVKARDYMATIEGGIEGNLLLLRHSHPDITREEVERLIDTEQFKEAERAVSRQKEMEGKKSPPEES